MHDHELYLERADACHAKASAALDEGFLGRAKRLFLAAGEYGYPKARVLLGLGIVCQYRNRYAAALQYLERALALEPEMPGAAFHAGRIYRLLGRRRTALEHFRGVLTVCRDPLLIALTLRELSLLGVTDSGLRSRMVGVARTLLGDGRGLARERAAALLTGLEGESQNAFLELRRLVQEHPAYVELQRDLALLHLGEQDTRRAIVALENARRRLPRDRELVWILARCRARNGEHLPAIRLLRRLARASLPNPAVFVNMGNIQRRLGHSVAALQAYRKALEIRRDYLPALFNLGCLYHESGSLDQARQCYLEARDAAPEYPYIFYNLGLLYYEEGDYVNACRALRRCLELKPEFAAARRSLRFVLLARTCYPNEGPEEGIGRVDKYYWIGVGSAVSVLVFTIMMGWL